MLARQTETSTNAELASLTVDEQFLNDAEAWVWLTTLQVALRSTAQTHGLHNDEQLAAADERNAHLRANAAVAAVRSRRLFLSSIEPIKSRDNFTSTSRDLARTRPSLAA